MHHRYIVGKYKKYLHEVLKQVEKREFGERF
jgi:hypothetical protein